MLWLQYFFYVGYLVDEQLQLLFLPQKPAELPGYQLAHYYRAADAIGGVAIDSSDLLSDIHGSADYRANLIKVMAERAVAAIA